MPTLVGAVVTVLFVAAFLYKPASIDRVSNQFFDHFQRQHPRVYDPDIPVRIIDIDDESIKRIGQWPWPRTTLAKMNDRLANAGAAVIAYDVIFSEADRTSPENMVDVFLKNPKASGNFSNISELTSHDDIFAESFQNTQVVTGIFLVGQPTPTTPKVRHGIAYVGESPINQLENYGGVLHALPQLDSAAAGAGSVSFRPTGDGIIRKAPLLGRVGERIYPSLSVEALRAAQGASTFIVKSNSASGELGGGNRIPEMASLRVGDFEIPTMADGKMNVYYTEPPNNSRYIEAWRILSDDPADVGWMDRVAGNIIFVGTGAEGLKDLVTTPFGGGQPGVMVHAQMAEQIITEEYLYRPYWADSVEFFGVLFLGILLTLVLPRLSAIRGVIIILLIGNTIYFTSYWAFLKHHYLIDPAYPLLAMITSYILITLTSYYMTESQRSRIQGAFSLYLSPDMVKEVSENPQLLQLGGEEREISILFMDIRSFSKISERMRPQDITLFLNKFLTPMTEILQHHQATIDKYMGDAIVAFWNAPVDDPVHERNAARAVLEMQNRLADLNAEYRNQNEFIWPDQVSVGIGINTGICCVGNLGSEQRFSYSMIGDAANLASRIEGLTKQYGISNLIGSSTAEALDGFALLEADYVSVVGRDTPERIFMLAGDEDVERTSNFQALKETQRTFLDAYREQDWPKARVSAASAGEFATSYKLHRYYDAMLARIAGYEAEPTMANWDGVYVAKDK